MENKPVILKCNEFPNDTIEFCKAHNDKVFVEAIDKDFDVSATISINPEDIYKFLADNYDLNELKEKAETK